MTLEVNSFPLPNILLLYQYITVEQQEIPKKIVFGSYETATLSFNEYTTNSSLLSVFKTSDQSALINWTHPYETFFSVQLVAIHFNALNISNHKIYAQSGTKERESH